MTYRISSNLTILFKLIIPVLWAVFFGSFAIAFFIADPSDTSVLYNPIFKYAYLGAFVLFGLLMYLTLYQLMRVELDTDYFYVTNYFQTVRYPYDEIERIREYDLLIIKLIRIRLHTKGRFGRSISFLVARTRLRDYLSEQPELIQRFLQKAD